MCPDPIRPSALQSVEQGSPRNAPLRAGGCAVSGRQDRRRFLRCDARSEGVLPASWPRAPRLTHPTGPDSTPTACRYCSLPGAG
jgi:hypothetical protein